MTLEKNGKFDLSEVGEDLNLSSSYKLLNITKLHKVSSIENNVFEPIILLETIISDLRRLAQRIDSLQKHQALLRKDLVEAGVLKFKI
jgi:hypothetical protein